MVSSDAYCSTSALMLFRQNATKKLTEPVAVPLDPWPERCTMTMKRKISTRASLIPILRLGPLLLSDTCHPTTGSKGREMSAPRPYATDPFRTYSSVPLTILRLGFLSIIY